MAPRQRHINSDDGGWTPSYSLCMLRHSFSCCAMADDGMLLNFAAPSDQAWAPKATFKGGRWKDRLTAKKAASHRLKRTAEPGERPSARSVPDYTQDESRQEFVRGPPAKRQRMDGQRDFVPGHSRGGANDRSRNEGGQDQRPPLKQVISSLFTYNPTSTVSKPAEEEAQDEEPVEPSNAPLSAELVPFTSLGLSPHVATHLLNKLQLKAPTAIQQKAVTQLVKDDSDAFIQAQTGSGKTLAYLLPIVQRLVNMSETMKKRVGNNGLSRESGLFAIILAPTRELSKQISTVLENVIGCAHWIVPGTVIGGEKKKSEKARLRKGMNILVATPGRLADHLENTEALDVSNVRWLVLDEGDRLMELGFEQDIQKIVSVLNLRMKARKVGLPGLPEKRTTVLCSATIKMDVQRLGEISLKNAAHLAAEGSGKKSEEGEEVAETAFSAPAQLKQAYGIVPAKLRLVTLVAVLRRAFARKGSVMKTIVFMSCADSVDFHFEVFTRAEEEVAAQDEADKSTKTETIADPEPEPALPKKLTNAKEAAKRENKIKQGGTIADTITAGNSPTLSVPNNPVQVFRLHGSLPQAVRTSTLKDFTKTTDPAVLICTDVASRGLDLPNVDFVVEYDPPFSKEDHLHRIGRTARAGRDGRALIFLQPGTEEGYVEILKEGRHDGGRGLTRHDADELLKRGFAASGVVSASANSREWEDKATTWQLDVERWALDRPKHLEQARRAYQSHIRAYATHVAAERGYFDIKQLHLGHLAKAFALRDRPGSINVPGLRPGKDGKEARKPKKGVKGAAAARGGGGKDDDEVDSGPTDAQLAFRKMRAKFNSMGGASEFNLG
ncbi:ATP-dependent RNA helicase dbp7 [Zalaria obscura]|uniref:ATP-dependent RNA helicase dbp7 n=1 Tax=Zalaria obscura TaxID=2024903 RepID=A0ACC3SNK7_9PEZI